MSKTKLRDLYFGVTLFPPDWSGEPERMELTTINIFGSCKVLWSVAKWALMDKSERRQHDFLPWCFFDYCGRTEYEFIISPWPYTDGDLVEKVGQKVDVYNMYIRPNEAILRHMVEEVSANSAREYLKEDRRRLKKD